MGTKNNPGAFDCYANAGPDEPMFVLLARDKHAPALVWLWAALRELDSEDPAKVKEARECCATMMEWALDHGKKPVGFGQAILAGQLDMIRTINHLNGIVRPENVRGKETDAEFVRRMMAEVYFGKPEKVEEIAAAAATLGAAGSPDPVQG